MTFADFLIVVGWCLYLIVIFRLTAKAIPHVPPQLPWKSAVDDMVKTWRRL